MDEKIIVRSEHVKIGGIVLFTVLFVVFFLAAIGCLIAHNVMYDMVMLPYEDAIDKTEALMDKADNFDTYGQYSDQLEQILNQRMNDPLVDLYYSLGGHYFYIALVAAAVFFVIAIVLWIIELTLKQTEMIVSDKRVYGFAGRTRVDLPIDSVTAISLGSMKSVSVTTASGAIKFSLIKNRDAIYDTVSALLLERQSKKNAPVATSAPAVDNADQLKKFKELLDSGVITEEEFEAKKKQLLGL